MRSMTNKPERSVEEKTVSSVYNEVLSAAKPLYDVDSTHVEIAIFEEDVYRRIEKVITQTLQAERQRCEEMVRAIKAKAIEADVYYQENCMVVPLEDIEALTQPTPLTNDKTE